MPKRVVFAVLLKNGEQITPDSLFAFSQVALAQTVRDLEEWGVKVELLGIKAEEPEAILSTAA